MIVAPTDANSGTASGNSAGPPLCVDLDHTLIRTDVLWESVVQLWRHPAIAVRAIAALLSRGKAAFKSTLANAVTVDVATLPYNEDVLAYARSRHLAGQKVILATASHRTIAQRVADHLGIFESVFATENDANLSGTAKRDVLVSAYGEGGYDYIGDSKKDLPIFKSARHALLASPSRRLLQQASAMGNVAHVFPAVPANAKTFARALRLHQWAKNALLAVPLLSAHLLLSPQAWVNLIIAFFGFGLVASATYLVNDLLDLQSDRQHARKRFRPLADGRLSIQSGLALCAASVIAGCAISLLLPPAFMLYLGVYVVLTLSYSFDLKRRLLVDVIALALLYTLRILAGGAAIGVAVSEWLLMFSLFIFLSLAFLKRVIEIAGSQSDTRIAGRGYSIIDLDTARTIGITSGLLSVMVLSLYISSPAVTQLYQAPQVLWLLCPLLIYWIARIWLLVARGEVHHDPVVFALQDWRSYVVGTGGLIIMLIATYGPENLRW